MVLILQLMFYTQLVGEELKPDRKRMKTSDIFINC